VDLKDEELDYSIYFIFISLMIVFMVWALCNLYLASDIVFLYCIAGDEMTRVIWKYIKDKVINHFLALIVIIVISFFFSW
jgi:hypothetical protein